MQLPKEVFVRHEVDDHEQYYVVGVSVEEALPPERERVKMGRYVLAESFWVEPKMEITSRIQHKAKTK